MHRLIGVLFVLLGVGALGWFASTNHAERLQSAIAISAAQLADSAPHDIQTTVSGRDLGVQGTVTDQTEYAVLLSAFEGIDGVRVVDFAGVQTLPLAAPYEITATRSADGQVTLLGVVPSNAARTTLEDATGGAQDLTLAAGVPDADWVGVVQASISALGPLKSGDAVVTDHQITLTGLAAFPAEYDAALSALGDLPDDYILIDRIDVEDDGAPLSLNLSLSDGGLDGAGKFPAGMPLSEVTSRFAIAQDVTIAQARIPAVDPAWPDVARTGMDALAQLVDGQLMIDGTQVSLSGVGLPNGIAQAQDLLATLPDTYDVTTSLGIWDDGVPLGMTMTWDGTQARATGKLPAGFTPRGPAGVGVTDTAERSFTEDTDGRFTRNANAGVAALGLMTTGTLEVSEAAITLTGTASSPQVAVVMDSVLAGVADTATVTRDLIYLDDGSPAAWTLEYDVAAGARVEGRLPSGLTTDQIATALGLSDIEGTPATALEDTDAGSSMDTLGIVAGYLPELEMLRYARDSNNSALDLTVAPGVDLDLVAIDLAERLPTDVAFSLSPSDDTPQDGATRSNAITGLDEVFRNGFWLSSLSFSADIAGCTAQAAGVLERSKITFLSSSARLDATSIRAINSLAAVVEPCIDAGLTLEIGGHTDATGSELANEVLSFNRATAVLEALSARGVRADAMTAIGYGQAQPIADNATPEGRAANRRTSLTWSDPATPTPDAPATDP